jgi:hypothetical protein
MVIQSGALPYLTGIIHFILPPSNDLTGLQDPNIHRSINMIGLLYQN